MIHATAIIDASAKIAADASVGPYAVIGPEVEIGSGTVVGAHATIHGPTSIGCDNRIHEQAVLGGAPQDLGYADEPTRLEIGDANVIREYVSISRGSVKGGGVTRVGNENFIMAYAHIGHDCRVGDNNIFTNSVSLAGHVEIGDQCNLGGFTLVHQYTRIGAHAFTSMGAAVNRDVPPFVIVSGNYARSYGINKIGLQRKGFTPDTLDAITRAYKLLVRRRVKPEQALPQLQPLIEAFDEVRLFVEFVRASARGIVR